jgi:hypothetical protein
MTSMPTWQLREHSLQAMDLSLATMEARPAEPGEEARLKLHQLGERAPEAAPDLAAHEQIDGHRQDAARV